MTEVRQIYDHRGTVVREVRYSSPDECTLIMHEHVDPLLKRVQQHRELEGDARRSNRKHVRLAAKVPMTVVEKAMREGWFNDRAAWRRWLNDSQNRDFRVWGGRV